MLNIRKGKKKDVLQLKKIDNFDKQLNRYSGLDRLDPKYKENKDEKSYYETFIYGKKKWCYVAEIDEQIKGFVLFNIEKRPKFFKIKKVGYIDLLLVEKKSRGKGISKALMKKAKEILEEEKIKYLKLSVHSENPATKVWKKHGFREYRIDMWKKL